MSGLAPDPRPDDAPRPAELSAGFQDMLGRLIADPDLRQAMAGDPERALAAAGIRLAPRELERVRAMTPDDRQRLMENVDPKDPRAWWNVVWQWVTWW